MSFPTIDVERIRDADPLRRGVGVLYAGRLEHKNVDLLLEAFDRDVPVAGARRDRGRTREDLRPDSDLARPDRVARPASHPRRHHRHKSLHRTDTSVLSNLETANSHPTRPYSRVNRGETTNTKTSIESTPYFLRKAYVPGPPRPPGTGRGS